MSGARKVIHGIEAVEPPRRQGSPRKKRKGKSERNCRRLEAYHYDIGKSYLIKVASDLVDLN
jgi:hypothetical protein